MDNDASAEYERAKYFNAGRAPERKRCTDITNLMARLATDNSEAAHVALKAQVVCVMCDLMEDHGIPFNRATAEVLEDLARSIRTKHP